MVEIINFLQVAEHMLEYFTEEYLNTQTHLQ